MLPMRTSMHTQLFSLSLSSLPPHMKLSHSRFLLMYMLCIWYTRRYVHLCTYANALKKRPGT